jgi:hypothetical protein
MNEVETKHLELLRRMGTVGRLRAAFELHEFARSRLTAHIRREHPAWTPEEIRLAVHDRLMRIR